MSTPLSREYTAINTNVLYGLRASNFFQSAGRALLLASRFHGRVPSLHTQDVVWVFVHRFLSKVLKAPDSCLVSGYDLVATCIGQCHIIALEVRCLFKTSFSRAVPTCWIYNVEAPLEGILRPCHTISGIGILARREFGYNNHGRYR
jgi:hypothetical protein